MGWKCFQLIRINYIIAPGGANVLRNTPPSRVTSRIQRARLLGGREIFNEMLLPSFISSWKYLQSPAELEFNHSGLFALGGWLPNNLRIRAMTLMNGAYFLHGAWRRFLCLVPGKRACVLGLAKLRGCGCSSDAKCWNFQTSSLADHRHAWEMINHDVPGFDVVTFLRMAVAGL